MKIKFKKDFNFDKEFINYVVKWARTSDIQVQEDPNFHSSVE